MNYIIKNRMVKYRFEMRFLIAVLVSLVFPLVFLAAFIKSRRSSPKNV